MLPRSLWFTLPVCVGLLFGCAAPNSPDAIMDRVDANREIYDTWPLPIKEAVLDARVIKGMTPDMVRVAIGKPDEEIDRGNGDVVWVYRRSSGSSSSMSPAYGGGMGGGGTIAIGGSPGGGVYMGGSPRIPVMAPPPPSPGYSAEAEIEIWFRNGVVVRGDGVK
jgi:hypothetical protein